MPEQIELIRRPTIGHLYTPGAGDIAECLACGPTHVVVKWIRARREHHVIYPREVFEKEFKETQLEHIEQPDLFGDRK